MRTGILGGTFDPVHSGHLVMARAAAAAARLDRVLLIPCARPPHKERDDLTDAYHRFGMLSLLVPLEPALAVSTVELRRGGVSYTVETLRAMAGGASAGGLFLIVGSDSFAEMASWKAYEEILSLAAILVIPRPGTKMDRLRERLSPPLASALRAPAARSFESIPDGLPFAVIVETDSVDVSSTEIRNRVRQGRPITGMVPAEVEAYIHRQGLYGPSPIG
jgi:nicotinate-nucleotide adenylyltransferase